MKNSTIAKGTASIKLAGGAEIATAAEPEALGLAAYGEPGRRCEAPLQGEARCVVEMPPREGEREPDALPRGLAQTKGAATKESAGIDMPP